MASNDRSSSTDSQSSSQRGSLWPAAQAVDRDMATEEMDVYIVMVVDGFYQAIRVRTPLSVQMDQTVSEVGEEDEEDEATWFEAWVPAGEGVVFTPAREHSPSPIRPEEVEERQSGVPSKREGALRARHAGYRRRAIRDRQGRRRQRSRRPVQRPDRDLTPHVAQNLCLWAFFFILGLALGAMFGFEDSLTYTVLLVVLYTVRRLVIRGQERYGN